MQLYVSMQPLQSEGVSNCWTGIWNGMVEWNGGMEWWNGMVEWNGEHAQLQLIN